MKYNGKTVLVTGDMSMAYDVAALSLPGIPDRMRIIVIDNNGGGIFRFIPSTSRLEERERYFCCALSFHSGILPKAMVGNITKLRMQPPYGNRFLCSSHLRREVSCA